MGWGGGDKQKRLLVIFFTAQMEPFWGGFLLIAVVLDFAPSFKYL